MADKKWLTNNETEGITSASNILQPKYFSNRFSDNL